MEMPRPLMPRSPRPKILLPSVTTMAVTTSAGQLYTMLACKEMVCGRCCRRDMKNRFGANRQVCFPHERL